MGASKNFFTELREKEQYANVSMKLDVYDVFYRMFDPEIDFTLNHIKEKNSKQKEDILLCELYKERSILQKKIIKREQEINHG